jgi:nitroreductase
MTTDSESKNQRELQGLFQRHHTLDAGDASTTVAGADTPVPENDLTRVLASRGTMRSFKPDPVPEHWVNAIVEYGMRAPTSSNWQAYSVVVVHDPELRKRLAELAGNQQHIINCPVYFAICADLTRVNHAVDMHGKAFPGRTLESCLAASLDASLLGMTMSLVADSFGLASVMIGGMRNNAVEVAKVLKLPPRCYVVFGLCLGWASKRPLAKPRHPLSGVIHHDVYDPGMRAQAIEAYDKDLARYYRARGVETPDAAWSGILSERFTKDIRTKLKQELISLGFPLD